MKFELQTLSLAAAAAQTADALIVPIDAHFEGGNDEVHGFIHAAIEAKDLDTHVGKVLHLYRCSVFAASRVVLVGAGDGSPKAVRQAVMAAVTLLKASQASHIGLCLSALRGVNAKGQSGNSVHNGKPATSAADVVAAAVAGAAQAAYVYTATKSKPEPSRLKRVVVGVGNMAGLEPVLAKAKALAAGIELAREWGNRPANFATPSMLAEVAMGLAKRPRVRCQVLSERQIAALGMGSFLAVAQGSREAARFIVLKYSGADKSVAPTVLVGKGITFDTGGISIKPAAEMDEMKFDMCGAASVLGVFRALGELQPAINVIGLIPSCENMPDGRAVKPGDVVRSMSGQTIEVLNTDAEGRLILCDALTYAERYQPRAVVDIATLTGACVVALGAVRSGLFSTDDALATALQEAGERAQDLCWRMPLDDEYADALKSNFADVGNVGGRAGGAITAAKFLQRFATKFPWAHLDIAGTAWVSGSAKGASGRPVALLLEYLLTAPLAPVVAQTPARAKAEAKPEAKVQAKPATKSAVKGVRTSRAS